jgi:molybdopterin-guanine dinucleotide biosynthesis protein A
MRSAIVLVGGAARRAGGREKYFFTFQGKTFIDRLVDTLKEAVDEIVIVARDPGQCERFGHLEGVRCIADVRQGLGPIGGLHAGALAAHGEYVFVAACDMPCINPGVVRLLFDAAAGYDAAIPSWNADMLEPLHAVYRRGALIEYLEEHESLSLRTMIWSINTRYVPVDTIREIDPDLLTFTNINNLEDLESIDPSAECATDDPRGPC